MLSHCASPNFEPLARAWEPTPFNIFLTFAAAMPGTTTESGYSLALGTTVG